MKKTVIQENVLDLGKNRESPWHLSYDLLLLAPALAQWWKLYTRSGSSRGGTLYVPRPWLSAQRPCYLTLWGRLPAFLIPLASALPRPNSRQLWIRNQLLLPTPTPLGGSTTDTAGQEYWGLDHTYPSIMFISRGFMLGGANQDHQRLLPQRSTLLLTLQLPSKRSMPLSPPPAHELWISDLARGKKQAIRTECSRA